MGSYELSDLASYSYAYTEEVATLLERISSDADLITLEFINHFYGGLSNRKSTARVLDRLRPEEYKRLRRKQADHLRLLISPKMDSTLHYKAARYVGRVHAMVGVGMPELMEAYHLYQTEIRKMLSLNSTLSLHEYEREKLYQALQLRLMLDMEAQVIAHAEADGDLANYALKLEERVRDTGNLQDLLSSVVEVLAEVDGIVGCLFQRADSQGLLQVEASDDGLGRQYLEHLYKHEVTSVKVNDEQSNGHGPAAIAWRSGQIQINDSYYADANMQVWREAAEAVGFRSSAAIPLVDESGKTFAMLSLYSNWPGFFSNNSRLTFLKQTQQALSLAVPRLEQGGLIPEKTRREYRRRLEQGGICLLYQPIIDLRTGTLRHVEALARMFAADSSIVPPNEFLQAFGQAELLKLFELGINQIGRDIHRWREDAGLNLSVGINLPTDGVFNRHYRDVLFKAIEAGEIDASQLRLELLEGGDRGDLQTRSELLEEFRQAGIALVQDDLGSGHSSLLRMDRIAFDEVKIDQGLVRNVLSEPQRALEFIYHLTRLAHGFGVRVTVEGLENQGLIEAATILGADSGQGFGIARPMSARELPLWVDQHNYEIDPSTPKTALGALAGYLLWEQRLEGYEGQPDLIEELIKAPSLVKRYVSMNDLQDVSMRALLDRNMACAMRGRNSAMYKHTRRELVRHLSERWLKERNEPT